MTARSAANYSGKLPNGAWVTPDAVPALMNGAALAVIPSRRDSFPLVALEAALMARPVVATRVGGLSELVVHQQTGLLVESENSQALAGAISFLLNSSATAARLGQAARRRALKEFGWDQHVNAYDALYRQLLRKDARRVSLQPQFHQWCANSAAATTLPVLVDPLGSGLAISKQ